MERCSACLEEKEASEFGPDKRKGNGLQGRCYACIRVYERTRYAADSGPQRAASLRRYYKARAAAWDVLGNQCRTCGETDPVVLQLDHVHGDGYTEGRNRGGNKTFPLVIANPARFQLLCANCHCRKTAADRAKRGVI